MFGFSLAWLLDLGKKLTADSMLKDTETLLIVVHMWIVNVNTPAATQAFNSFVFSILTFDVIPMDTTYDKWIG